MGRTHRNEDTEPLLAQPLGFVKTEDILYAVKAIVCTQRDNGRRDDRKQVGRRRRPWGWKRGGQERGRQGTGVEGRGREWRHVQEVIMAVNSELR